MVYLEKSTDQQAVYIPKDEYTGTPGGHTTAILQSKDWEITQNGITRVTPDAGYDGISGGSIVVYVNSDTATTFEHLTAEENGTYVPTGNTAYSAVTVDVDTETPYEEGYASGYTSGVTHQKSLLASTAITLNGRYTREDGWNEVTVNVPTGSTINNQTKYVAFTANTATTVTFDTGYTGLESVGIIVNVPEPEYTELTATTNGTYTPSGYDAYSAVTVNVPQTGGTNQDKTVTITEDIGQNTSYISAHTSVTYDVGYTGLGDVDVDVAIPCINSINIPPYTVNGNYRIDAASIGFDDRTFRSANIIVQVPQTGSTVVLSGLTATINYNTYYPVDYNCDGFNSVRVEVDPTPYYNSGYTEGYASGYTSGETVGYNSGYTEGYNEGYSSGSTQGYDEGYASGYTTGYQSGYTRGDQEGYASGVTHQKSLLASTAITANGTYTRENGWNEVSVNVPPAPIVTLTQAQYDSLDPKSPTTIYLIKD